MRLAAARPITVNQFGHFIRQHILRVVLFTAVFIFFFPGALMVSMSRR